MRCRRLPFRRNTIGSKSDAMAYSRRKAAYDEAALFEYALGALGRRMRSVAELKRLLRQRVGSQEDGEQLVEAVVGRLKDRRYVNDTDYATAYASYRRENEKFGAMRVVRDLKSKGVHSDIIAKTMSEAYAGVDDEQLARQYLARKRLRKPADDKQTARIFRTLVRAGFASRTILAILRKWEVADEVIDSLESDDALCGE